MIKFYTVLSDGIRYFIQHKDFVIGGFIAIGAAATAAGIAFSIANAPLVLMSTLILGAIGLFALIYDDIKAFQNGQRSLIGYFINHYPRAAQVVKTAFDVMKKAAYYLLHPIELILNALLEVSELIDSVFHGGNRKLSLDIVNGNKVVKEGSFITSVSRGAGASNTSNKNSVTTGDITINTQATDAKGIASNLKSEINQQMAQVANYHADGVRA